MAIFRKSIVFPAEHGSWTWLLVPWLVGGLVGGNFAGPVWLVLVGSLALFLVRQPATVWLRSRRGRARQADGAVATLWLLSFSLIALGALVVLLIIGYAKIFWLGLPLGPLLALYLAAANRRRADVRALWMEIAGAAGLAVTAPAAYVAATGQLTPIAWQLWALLAALNSLGALYVRLRIADTHGRFARRWPLWAVAALLLVGATLAAQAQALPSLTILPFAVCLLRALWVSRKPRPIARIKPFGFLEVGITLVLGLALAAAYLL